MILLFLSAGKVLASYADVLLARHAILFAADPVIRQIGR